MKILIVDDETFFRVSFKSLINWNENGFEIVGEASDGEEAIEKIKKLKPDIIFLDITMPKVNGIEVIRELNHINLSCKVIVLSSYNEFKYVRDAMKLGAFDYIHKPTINRGIIITTLMKAKEALEKDREKIKEYNSLKNDLEKNKTNIKRSFLKELFDGKVRLESINEKIIELDIRIDETNINSFVITIDDFKNIKRRYKNNNIYVLYSALKNISNEIFKDEEEIEMVQYSENMFLVIKSYSKVRSINEIINNNNLISNRIKNSLKQFLNIDVTIGISSLCTGFEKIPLCFSEGLKANKLKFFLGRGQIIHYSNYNSENFNNYINGYDNMLNEIENLIKNETFEEVKTLITDSTMKINEKKSYNEHQIITLYKNIYYLVREKFSKLQNDTLSTDYEFTNIEKIINAENIFELNNYLFEAIDDIILIIEESKNFNIKNNNIKIVLEYINQNYNKELSLTELAEYVGLNRSYLSRLFKEETGMSLINYINKFRIDKAIIYLKESNLKNYEISELVGYQNVEYFNTIFKKITGKSPTELKSNF